MFYKKLGIPEESELVLCTVKKISPHSIFVSIDEYDNLEGMIHISEVSPGRIRNIRDFVKEEKKVICKVLRVNKEKKQIDLSLRRVSLSLRKKKSTEYKQMQKAEKILEIIAEKLNVNLKDVYEKIGYKIIENYGSLYNFFQEVVENPKILDNINAPKNYLKELLDVIKEKVKPIQVEINKTILLKSLLPNGIDIIRDTMKIVIEIAKEKKYDIIISYISAPKYNFKIIAKDYKTAETSFNELTGIMKKYMKENNSELEIIR